VSEEGAAELAADATAKDFASDAFAHCKFIGMTPEAEAIFAAAGLAEDLDEACTLLEKAGDAAPFVAACGALRFWQRELKVDLDAKPAPAAR
jgi:catalase